MKEEINDELKMRLKYIRGKIGKERGVERRKVESIMKKGNMWKLKEKERWIMYRYWVERMRNVMMEKISEKHDKLR
jgi:hypothetical protein